MSGSSPTRQIRPDSSILLLHSCSSSRARHFVHDLVQGGTSKRLNDSEPAQFPSDKLSSEEGEAEDVIQWDIDNKYYSATVHFQLQPTASYGVRGQNGTGIASLAGLGSPGDGDGGVGMAFARDVGVIVYVFDDRAPDPLPPVLTRLINAEPRDIALAVRLGPPSADMEQSQDDREPSIDAVGGGRGVLSPEQMQERFDELGMELVDTTADEGDDNDDDRPVEPIERIRQTLMTHMWPNMERKPTGVRIAMDGDGREDALGNGTLSSGGIGRRGVGSDSGANTSDTDSDNVDFPVTFNRTHALLQGISSPAFAADLREHQAQIADRGEDDFPSLASLNQQLAEANRAFAQIKVEREMASERRMMRLDRLERELAMDSDDEDELGPDENQGEGLAVIQPGGARDSGDEEEEDWGGYQQVVDSDDEEEGGVITFDNAGPSRVDGMGARTGSDGRWARLDTWLDEDDIGSAGPSASQGVHFEQSRDQPTGLRQPDAAHSRANSFDDDFAGATHPRPSVNDHANGESDARLPLDPTPLLLHLQSVRAELANVGDDDERRVRAAREVAAVMRSLGIEGVDVGILDEDEEVDQLP